MDPISGAVAAAAAQAVVEFVIDKVAEAVVSQTKGQATADNFHFGFAQQLYALAENRRQNGKQIAAKTTYYETITKLRQSRRNRRRELAHCHLCVAEIWQEQAATEQSIEHVIKECDQALALLRKQKSDLPQIARALHLKCQALMLNKSDDALLFGLYAYGIEACCYENGGKVHEYSNSLLAAWQKASGQHHSEFSSWLADALKELSIKKGKYRGIQPAHTSPE